MIKFLKDIPNKALRIALLGSVITAVILVILVGASWQRRAASQSLQNDLEVIEENFTQRKQSDLERLAELETELAQAQDQVQELKGAFPDPNQGFALYQQALDLARGSQMNLARISRSGSEVLETDQGTVQATTYSLVLTGTAEHCTDFLGSLEDAGMQSLATDQTRISTTEEICELDARVFSLPEGSESLPTPESE